MGLGSEFPLPRPDAVGRFRERLNRFLGVVEVEGGEEYVHIHDPGRLKELLYPGVRTFLRRKTGGRARYCLLSVDLGSELVLVDPTVHNGVAAWLIEKGLIWSGYSVAGREPRFGRGRFDLALTSPTGNTALVEVKGVTLERDGVALFPDAPTSRGARHMEELAGAVRAGYEGKVLFLVFRSAAVRMSPNRQLDPRFAEALTRAFMAGVEVRAYKLVMVKWALRPVGPLPVDLHHGPDG